MDFDDVREEKMNRLEKIVLKAAKAILVIQIGVLILAAVLYGGVFYAMKTNEDNFITAGIDQIKEFIIAKMASNSVGISFSTEEVKENVIEETVEETQEPITEDPVKEDISDNKEVTYYAVFAVPEGVNFDIKENLDYICHDIFSDTLIPCLTDERVKLAGIVDFQSEYFTAMVVVDASSLESEEDINRIVNEQVELAMNRWNEIMLK